MNYMYLNFGCIFIFIFRDVILNKIILRNIAILWLYVNTELYNDMKIFDSDLNLFGKFRPDFDRTDCY